MKIHYSLLVCETNYFNFSVHVVIELDTDLGFKGNIIKSSMYHYAASFSIDLQHFVIENNVDMLFK